METRKKVVFSTVIHKARNGYWVNIMGMYPEEVEAMEMGIKGGFITTDEDKKLLTEMGFVLPD